MLIFCRLSAENIRTVHIFVALCDNVNQGIVPVPAFMGNGKDTKQNLYWGLAGGVKTYFKNSKEWRLIKTIRKPKNEILERVIFKHKTSNVYLLADAYDGAEIKQTIIDFFKASSGDFSTTIKIDSLKINFGGNSNLISYIGHDGLMDFNLDINFKQNNTKKRDAIILACISKRFFAFNLKQTGANPLVWTTGLMAPEAYTLKWALDGWVLNESDKQIRERAAQAYNKYQKCGIKASRNLLVTGW
ncbi:MAG: hypothetical protein K8S23_16775 [Candidatus Cloacimonetes bacterium]|nr:hypothetical protein [Candidatus Cloacimonadota bacterium]